MQFLIEKESDTPQTISVIQILDAMDQEFDPVLDIKEERSEPIIEENVPIVSEPNRTQEYSGGPAINIYKEELAIGTAPQSVLPMSNNIMTPLMHTTPNYPSRALQRGLEEFVELSFTVDRFGSAIRPVVINALHEGIFDRAALQAISR